MKITMACWVLFPSWPLGHQVERRKKQKGQQKALYAPHEHGRRQPSGRQILMSQINFSPECKEYIGLGNLGSNPNCIKWHA